MGANRDHPRREDPCEARSGEGETLREVEAIDRRIAALMAEAARLRRALRALVRKAPGG